MADEDKTRILTWQDVGGTPPEVEPRIVDEKIMFACPNGHTLRVPLELGGKRGKCSKCGVPLQIPAVQHEEESLPVIDTGSNEPVVDEVPPFIDVSVTAKSPPAAATQPSPAGPARVPPPIDDPGTEDWNFEVAGQTAPAAPPGAWQSVDDGHANPTARLVARLWAERDHGGIVELHLAGGSVILPEFYEPNWSRGTHGLFASQTADGSVTLTAVAWDTVLKIVVRQLTAVPDDMFT
jgi:hypothetical protein